MKNAFARDLRALCRRSRLDALWLPVFPSTRSSFLHHLSGLPIESASRAHYFFSRAHGAELYLGPLERGNSFQLMARSKPIPPKSQWVSRVRSIAKKRVGTVLGAWPVDLHRAWKKELDRARFVDVFDELGNLRAQKKDFEIDRIQKAVRLTRRVLERIPDWVSLSTTEHQLASRISIELALAGQSPLAFPTIVASGANAGVPHHVPARKKLKRGWLLIDCGGRFGNYCADMSRTFFFGSPSPRQKALYENVRLVQQEAVDECTPGRPYGEVFDWANRRLLALTKMPLIHGLGHGLGVDVHDFPNGFLANNKSPMQTGHVLTVEPGVYGKWGGIRIEDDGIMTKNGFKFFSASPKTLEKM